MDNQTNNSQNNNGSRGCLKFIIYFVVIALALFYVIKSCGGNHSDYSNMSSSNNSVASSNDYSWIVGTWACDMGAYGTVVVKFDGNGMSGDCTEIQYGSYKYGTYQVNGNTLSYKLNGEAVSTAIEIQSGHRLSAGGGYYYHKR